MKKITKSERDHIIHGFYIMACLVFVFGVTVAVQALAASKDTNKDVSPIAADSVKSAPQNTAITGIKVNSPGKLIKKAEKKEGDGLQYPGLPPIQTGTDRPAPDPVPKPETCGPNTVVMTEADLIAAAAGSHHTYIADQPGMTYCLAHDATVEAGVTPSIYLEDEAIITIAANNVTIDLNGHTLHAIPNRTVRQIVTAIANTEGYSGLIVQDGRIIAPHRGIQIGQHRGQFNTSYSHVIAHVDITAELGVGFWKVEESVVRDSVFSIRTGLLMNDVRAVRVQDNFIDCPFVLGGSFDLPELGLESGISISDGANIDIEKYRLGNVIRRCVKGVSVGSSNDVVIRGNIIEDVTYLPPPSGPSRSSTPLTGGALIYNSDSQDVVIDDNYLADAKYGVSTQRISGTFSEFVNNDFCDVDIYFETNGRDGAVPTNVVVRNNKDVCADRKIPENEPFPQNPA